MDIVTFFQKNIPPRIVDMQRRVFDKFKLNIRQVYTDLPHGRAMDRYLQEHGVDKCLMFIDIDCIPLDMMAIPRIMSSAHAVRGITGIRQNPYQLGTRPDYAGPACLSISERAWEKLSDVSMTAVMRRGKCLEDVGCVFTREAGERKVPIHLMEPTDCENPQYGWQLDNGTQYGYGTTYDDCIYHAFRCSVSQEAREQFILKATKVLQS